MGSVFSEVRQELDEVIEAGDGEILVSVVRSCVRMRHTGLEFELPWATVWTIRGGKGAARPQLRDEGGGARGRSASGIGGELTDVMGDPVDGRQPPTAQFSSPVADLLLTLDEPRGASRESESRRRQRHL